MDPTQVRGRAGGPPTEQDFGFIVSAAQWAPSMRGIQPWRVSRDGSRITLRADMDRRPDLADPDGREMLISCGAALFTLRLAARMLGYEPEVELLPDPDRPYLLADLLLGARIPESVEIGRLYGQIRTRRIHRGPFRPVPIRAQLLSVLRYEAQSEGASLRMMEDTHTVQALAALSQVAEHVQQLNPAYVSGSVLLEQVVTGVVAVLSTVGDEPFDRMRAGQALQRLLLRAAAEEGLSAAFHTQVLEVPELRTFVGTRFCDGLYPQLVLRLGHAGDVHTEKT